MTGCVGVALTSNGAATPLQQSFRAFPFRSVVPSSFRLFWSVFGKLSFVDVIHTNGDTSIFSIGKEGGKVIYQSFPKNQQILFA